MQSEDDSVWLSAVVEVVKESVLGWGQDVEGGGVEGYGGFLGGELFSLPSSLTNELLFFFLGNEGVREFGRLMIDWWDSLSMGI